MSLTFTHNGHRYRLDGRPVPSVTTIINAGLPKPALVGWAARTVAEAAADMPSTVDELRRLGRGPFVAALAAVPNERRNTAATRGTDIHRYAEQVVAGLAVDVPSEVADAVSGYARWLDDFGFVSELTERPIANRGCWYAGRFDVYGDMHNTRWLLDVKTSNAVYGDASLQLAAYARAEVYVDDDTDGEPHEYPVPPVDRIGVLHVRDDGTDLYDLGNIDDAFAEFRAAQVIHAGATRRKNLVDVPVQSAAVGGLW
jgi:hypothetical protein